MNKISNDCVPKTVDRYDWNWVEAQVADIAHCWNQCATALSAENTTHYSSKQQAANEKVYDEALDTVEHEVQHAPRNNSDRDEFESRLIASFAHFSARALGLSGPQIQLLTTDFVPVGTELARWARHFDPTLEITGIIQAARNAWTACGLQPLLGLPVKLTPAILGYSLLYPYSDNFLDDETIPAQDKLAFSRRFRSRLNGEELPAIDHCEECMWALIALIEKQFPRTRFPQVFDGLLAIHQAQESSISQLEGDQQESDEECLRLSCSKGGTSVLADACLARGFLNREESRFAFDWGVLLQLGDDLQDVEDDLRRGSKTLFSRAASEGKPLDKLTIQLLNFSDLVSARMEALPHGTRILKDLLKMSWRSLIIRAVADSHKFFSPAFVREAERRSPFRFEFLRARSARLASSHGLYIALFNALLETPAEHVALQNHLHVDVGPGIRGGHDAFRRQVTEAN